jgi:uroporphyrinogen decarboxylase
MAKQLLIDATRGQRTAMAPWVPYAGVHCAYLIGHKADAYFLDPELMARGVEHAARRYHADGIPLAFDLSLEAQAVGCQVQYWEDNVPSVSSHPLAKQTPTQAGFRLPTREDGRWPVLFEAARLLKPRLEALDCAMLGLMTGPLTLASHLTGVGLFTALVKNKPFAHEVLRYAGQVGDVAAGFYLEMGCDIVAIVDPVSSQIRPETFREFVTPNCQPAIERIRQAGRPSTFFICGDCTKVVEEVCRLGTDAFAVDEQMNMNFIREVARRHGKGFGGNLKLTLALSLGMISPREDALISLAAGGTHGYTFAPGCDLPFDTPPQHLEQACEARSFFYQHYPPYPEG